MKLVNALETSDGERDDGETIGMNKSVAPTQDNQIKNRRVEEFDKETSVERSDGEEVQDIVG